MTRILLSLSWVRMFIVQKWTNALVPLYTCRLSHVVSADVSCRAKVQLSGQTYRIDDRELEIGSVDFLNTCERPFLPGCSQERYRR